MRIADRVRHHSNEQIVDSIRDALEIAELAGLKRRDRRILLPSILDLASRHHMEVEQTQLLPVQSPRVLG